MKTKHITTRFSEYRIMWCIIMFDLPTLTKRQRRAANRFRIDLKKEGFEFCELSVYARHCTSLEAVNTHCSHVKKFLPSEGLVLALPITDRQFREIRIMLSEKPPQTMKQMLDSCAGEAPPEQIEFDF